MFSASYRTNCGQSFYPLERISGKVSHHSVWGKKYSWKANMTIDDPTLTHRDPCHYPSGPFGCPWPQALLYAWSVSVSAECKMLHGKKINK